MLYDAGRVCMKIAGKEAGRYCVVLERIDDSFVLIEGEVTRKRCNISHLEPLNITLDVKKNSDKKEILAMLDKQGLLKDKKEKKAAKEKKARKEKPVKKNAAAKKQSK